MTFSLEMVQHGQLGILMKYFIRILLHNCQKEIVLQNFVLVILIHRLATRLTRKDDNDDLKTNVESHLSRSARGKRWIKEI